MKQICNHHFSKRLRAFLALFLICVLSVTPITCVQAAGRGKLIPGIILTSYRRTIAIDEQFHLIAITTNGKFPTFRSSNSKIASVNTYGLVTGKKAGTVTITAKISRAEASCKVIVEKPTITISQTSLSLENGEEASLQASISTNHEITWKSAKSSIASVDENGLITAKKCGSTIIRATADGVTAKCKVTVRKPKLSLERTSLKLFPGDSYQLIYHCSSMRPVTFRSSSSAVACVDDRGWITANKKGRASITVKVDGVSRICQVSVLQPKT